MIHVSFRAHIFLFYVKKLRPSDTKDCTQTPKAVMRSHSQSRPCQSFWACQHILLTRQLTHCVSHITWKGLPWLETGIFLYSGWRISYLTFWFLPILQGWIPSHIPPSSVVSSWPGLFPVPIPWSPSCVPISWPTTLRLRVHLHLSEHALSNNEGKALQIFVGIP